MTVPDPFLNWTGAKKRNCSASEKRVSIPVSDRVERSNDPGVERENRCLEGYSRAF